MSVVGGDLDPQATGARGAALGLQAQGGSRLRPARRHLLAAWSLSSEVHSGLGSSSRLRRPARALPDSGTPRPRTPGPGRRFHPGGCGPHHLREVGPRLAIVPCLLGTGPGAVATRRGRGAKARAGLQPARGPCDCRRCRGRKRPPNRARRPGNVADSPCICVCGLRICLGNDSALSPELRAGKGRPGDPISCSRALSPWGAGGGRPDGERDRDLSLSGSFSELAGLGDAVNLVKSFRAAACRRRAPCGFHIKPCAFQKWREQRHQRLELVLPVKWLCSSSGRGRSRPGQHPRGACRLCPKRMSPRSLHRQRVSPCWLTALTSLHGLL